MDKLTLLGISLLAMLATFFLISYGTYGDAPGWWWAGLLLLGAGGLVPPITRYAYKEQENEKNEK